MIQNYIIFYLSVIAICSWVYTSVKGRRLRDDLAKKEKNINHRIYELSILKELGDRMGYSLDVKQIVDIITGSLHQFIEYSAVSYMILEPEKILYRVHLEKSVSRNFVKSMRERMQSSLSALLDKELAKISVEEVLSGVILTEEKDEPILSFFNIPVVIGGRVAGIITVAHTKAGLYKEDEMTILYKITNQASEQVTKLQEVVAIEQRKLNAMVESMADGIVMTDTDYKILVANPAAKKAIGLPADKKDVTIFDFIEKTAGRFDIRGHLEQSVRLRKSYMSERVIVNDTFFQVFVFPVINTLGGGHDSVLGGVVLFHDVTLAVRTEQLQKDFTSMLVHELRSPLDGIKRISDLLRQNTIPKDSEKYDNYLRMIYNDSSGMLDLVSDILDVAKLEAGKFTIRKSPSSIRESINKRIDFYTISAKDAGIALSANISSDIPERTEFDPEGVEHVLNNLLSNALKFTKKDGKIIVSAFLHKKSASFQEEMKKASIQPLLLPVKNPDMNDSLVILVTDTGQGIQKNELDNLFRKFKQLDAPAPKAQKGTGLGLVITKGIVEEHGGEIGIVSEPNVGSTFFFTIPLA